jgi:hypothetical protein
MKWQDFLDKLTKYKTEYEAQPDIKLNVSTLTTLLFSGAMDEMFDSPPTPLDYQKYSSELRDAIGSNADPEKSKAKKGQTFRIVDINNDAKLNVWRGQTNPTHIFSLIGYYKDALGKMGFEGYKSNDVPAVIKKADYMGIKRIDTYMFRSWTALSDSKYQSFIVSKTISMVGMVQDWRVTKTKKDTEMATFNLLIGDEVAGPFRVWSNEKGIIPYAASSLLQEGAIGVLFFSAKPWNGVMQGSFLKFSPLKT